MDFHAIDRVIEAELFSLFDVVWRRKYTFASVSIFCFVMLFAGILALQPTYEGSTLLLAGQLTSAPVPTGPAGSGPAQPTISRLSLEQIAVSDEVVLEAIKRVGLTNLVNVQTLGQQSIFMRLRSRFFEQPFEVEPVSPIEAALPRIKVALSARTETNSDVVTVSYRDPNPNIAQQFSAAVAQAFIDRQIVLYSRPGVADFLKRQKQQFDSEIQAASNELATFSIASGTYAPDEQRKLVLGQISDLDTEIAKTRELIVTKAASRQTAAEELRRLSPVARSPWVSGLVDSLAGPNIGPAPKPPPLEDPPLLLIRVYQESMADLFKVNADIAGAQAREMEQLSAMTALKTKLNELTATEQRYASLRRKLDQATANSSAYAKRVVEQELDDASNTAKLSPIRILQMATVPRRPVFPNYIVMFVAAAVVSATVATGLAMLTTRTKRR